MALLWKIVSKNNVNSVCKLWSRGKSQKSHPVKCKVALITGGSIGIGVALANSILKCGAKAVMLGDIREEEGEKVAAELNKKYGNNKAFFLKTDVCKKEELENLFECTLEKYKQLDIVVNNAGLLNDKQWEKELEVNVIALVRGTLMGFDYMGKHKKRNGGIIVNVASIYGLQTAYGCPVYCGTKHFIIGFDRCFSHEYYRELTGVSVLTLCPGVTDTNMITEAKDWALEGFGDVGKILADGLANLPSQPAEACGTCLLKMICKNEGIWVSEENECYKVELPDRHTMRADEDC